ncbi:MAG: nitrate reductase [Planctomycetota bacterium]|nr:MAG: nitrate reductase [Planctomycetota bacterium]
MNQKPNPLPCENMTRRELLKWLGLTTGATLAAPLISSCSDVWKRPLAIPVQSWHRSVCRFCGTGCTIQIGLDANGKIVDVKGDEYGHNKGRLCIKGVLNRDLLYTKDRLTQPLIRKNGKLTPASWQEAMDLVCQTFAKSIEKYGPNSVAFYGSGQLFTQESYTANKIFKGGIGTNNVDGNPRLCMASAAVGYIHTFGKDEPLGCYEDFDHAHCFFLTGTNTAECHPILWERILDRKRSYPKTKIIVVDPRRTKTAQNADLHLQIIPGTDAWLYNSMMHEFIRLDLVKKNMLKYITFQEHGSKKQKTYQDFVKHCQQFPPQKIAPICGISPNLITEAAYLFASSPATMSVWTMGINQQSQGAATNRLIMAMNLITGQIGKPGATPFSLTGQPNACGGVRDTGTLAHALPYGRVVMNPKHREITEKLWFGKVKNVIQPKPGKNAVELFRAMESGEIQCTLVMCTNPAQSLPNLERYRKAMEKAFLVVCDAYHPTETTKLANVVLPSAMWAEKEGMFGQTERRYQYLPKLVQPPGQAKSDLEILIQFGKNLAKYLQNTKKKHLIEKANNILHLIRNQTPADIWKEWIENSKGSKYDFSGITQKRLQNNPGLRWPCPSTSHPGTKRRYVVGEDPLAKKGKKGELDFYGKPHHKAVIWLYQPNPKPQDPPTPKYPFILTTGRILEHWHTMTMTGRLEKLKNIHPNFLQIHPVDAKRLQIKPGQKVLVRGKPVKDPKTKQIRKRGETIFYAQITDIVRPGVVFATFHSAKFLVNNATYDVYDPMSKEPEYKLCAVALQPLS